MATHSSLENPRDGGAWWAAVYGVAQRLSDLAAAAAEQLSLSTHQNKTNKNNNKNKSRDPGRKSVRKTRMLLKLPK